MRWKFWRKQPPKLNIRRYNIDKIEYHGGKTVLYFNSKDMFNVFCNDSLYGDVPVFHTKDGGAMVDLQQATYIYTPQGDTNEKDTKYIG